jgi:hypothetical protein
MPRKKTVAGDHNEFIKLLFAEVAVSHRMLEEALPYLPEDQAEKVGAHIESFAAGMRGDGQQGGAL